MTDLLLMRSTLREALRPRRLGIAALLMLLPVAIGLLWRLCVPAASFDPDEVYDGLVVGLVFSFTLTILSVIYGTAVVSQELEQRTIVYLLTRPLPRWRLLLAKSIVAVAVVAAITLLSAVLLAVVVYGPTRFADADVGLDLRALALGALAYGTLSVLIGASLPRPLTWGLLLVFGWETWVPNLPGAFARLSVMSYVRALAARDIAPPPADASGSGNLFAALAHPNVDISSGTALVTLLVLSAVAIVGAMVVFSNREYVPREDAE